MHAPGATGITGNIAVSQQEEARSQYVVLPGF